MFMDIDIIMRVCMKKISYQMSINKGEQPQRKVAMQVFWELSIFFFFSLSEEL